MSAYYNEFDPKAAAWLRELIKQKHIADGEVDERSILDVRPDELRGYTQCHFFAGIGGWSYALRLAGWPDSRNVWTGSPPCQPFSSAGRRDGRDDARHLAPHFVDLVRACRPRVLFGEQVASADVFGKVAGGHREQAARAPQWAWFDDLCDRLEAARYAVGASDIASAGVGAPHIRQRTFFGAIRLADAYGKQCEQGLQQVQTGSPERIGRDSKPMHGLGHADDTRPQEHRKSGELHIRQSDRQDQGRQHVNAGVDVRQPQQSRSPDGFWRDADWLFCRDGKWRAIEPGTFPLADGIPARVGRLRGYGNAINPWAAEAFVSTFNEVMEIYA